ncbi:MAG: M48 family metallopeptidase [Polyangiaceae bacterium]|nr:M48 family metallopeptidase [Polyangiaceae bacterium]
MNRASLLARSIVAILLLIGFYVLALGIAAGLLWTVYAQVVIAERVFVKLALICVVLAGVILWSVLPRLDRFEPPGPQLTEHAHPQLFALIRDVADKTGQAMPREVYLVADVNAFVAQRGGIMGLFSRRVMGLGLPLLALLSVSELRAVLAHEFGHFHGGDTMLGPWIYKTRSAMARTIIALAERGSSIVRKPFEWYGNFFLGITHSISRAQELSADALAARVAGGRHLVSGLKATHAPHRGGRSRHPAGRYRQGRNRTRKAAHLRIEVTSRVRGAQL